MNINSVSFKGLWVGPIHSEKIGTHERYGCPLYGQTFVYHPFKDEEGQDIFEATKNTHEAVFALDDERNLDPYGPEAYYMAYSKLGKKLNITADEYAEIQKMQASPYVDTSDFKYSRLNENEKKEVFVKIV